MPWNYSPCAGCLAEDSTGNVVQSNVHAEHEEVYLDASPAINQGDRVVCVMFGWEEVG